MMIVAHLDKHRIYLSRKENKYGRGTEQEI